VQASRRAQSLQRLLFRKTLANDFKHRHLLRGPLDLALAGIRQGNILDVTFLHFRDSHSDAPRMRSFWIPIAEAETAMCLCCVELMRRLTLARRLRRPR